MLIDQLSWEEFFRESNNRTSLPKKISAFNRLVGHTKNFFIISGYGAFTPGYLLIVSKDFLPSFGLVKEDQLDELSFLIKIIKQSIQTELDRKSVIFEHGMCACIGGLDRAHIHIMSVPKNSTEKTIEDSINSVLYDRKAGIEYIEYNNYKLQNFHDINHLYEDIMLDKNKTKEFKIVGKILSLNDIKNLQVEKWPLVTLDYVKKGGHYVYFKSDFDNSSFLTTNNFETQFGREVVFQNELTLNKKFKNETTKLQKGNKDLSVWRWQHYTFEENILNSMKIAKKSLNKLENEYREQYKNFELKII